MNDLWKLKENQFVEVFSLLENYGFKYNVEKKQYENKYNQSIQFRYYRLDPNLYVPRIYIDNNNYESKRVILNVNEHFKSISKKKFKSERYKLRYIVENELNEKNSIFGLIITKEVENNEYRI